MSFASLHFAVFFPIAVLLYYATPGKWRWLTLLASSYYFYGSWRVEFLLLLMATTLVDYLVAIAMGSAATQRRRRWLLGASVLVNLGVLFTFKYWTFFSESVRWLLAPMGVAPAPTTVHFLLPVGISFFTFQTLAYTIDVYRGRFAAERHLGYFALYIAFFPQLVAGPIERPQSLLPQLRKVHGFSSRRVVSGLTRMAWGFFLKLVIADRLAVAVNEVYNHPAGQTAGSILLATYLFAFQLYADFAGYTDIAIGGARVLGIDLMENFRRPFFAVSTTDFWRRWHISLSTWFYDYVFKPLGGARKGRVRSVLNVMVVFVLSGLWHGAKWTFVLSGCVYAVVFLFGHVTRRARNAGWDAAAAALGGLHARAGAAVVQLRPWLARIITFHLLCFAFLFFRSNSIAGAWQFVWTLAKGAGGLLAKPAALGAYQFSIALTGMVVLLLRDMAERERRLDDVLVARAVWVRWLALYALVSATLMLAYLRTEPFVYFQF